MKKITIVLPGRINSKMDNFSYIKNLFKNKQPTGKEEKQLKGRLLYYKKKNIDPIF